MKIQYASDLHLEFGANSVYLRNNPLVPIGDVLVLAGDIGYLSDDLYFKHPFWDWASDNFEQVIVIPGNHELYNYFDINELHEDWVLNLRSNVRCVYNSIINLDDDTDLIASTLWSEIHVENAYLTERNVSDFHQIRNGEYRLTWERFNEEHSRCRNFIERSIAKSNVKNLIVATHHVPSFQLMPDEFTDSPINGAFTSELENFITTSRIRYWIYGHSHRNINLIIGKTHCVCNQLGYVSCGEHLTFRPNAVLEM